MKIVTINKRAFHDYEILERYEAGMVLTGEEAKRARSGQVSLKGSLAKIKDGELWLLGAHFGGTKEPERTRKLLMHKREIEKIFGKSQMKGLYLVPLRMYFKRNFLKVELGLGKIRKLYDKRELIKKREIEREIRRTKFKTNSKLFKN